MPIQRLPEICGGIVADFRQVNHMAVLLRPVADHPGIGPVLAFEVNAEEHPPIGPKLTRAQDLFPSHVVIQQGRLAMQGLEGRVGNRDLSLYKTDLVQTLPSADFDGKGPRDHFQKKRTVIAGADFIKPDIQIRHHAREDVEPSRGAFGIRSSAQRFRKLEMFQEGNQIDVAFF